MKWIKDFLREVKYKIKKWSFLRILNSPFKPLSIIFYWGKIRYGTPFFYPRKLVNNKEKPGRMKFKPVKWLWINMISLGWKLKWDEPRYEWAPAISIVLLKTQIFIFFKPKLDKECPVDHYWEAWLYYDKRTDKSKPMSVRAIELFELHSCTWIRYEKQNDQSIKVSIDYYKFILKKKYLKLYEEWKLTQKKDKKE